MRGVGAVAVTHGKGNVYVTASSVYVPVSVAPNM